MAEREKGFTLLELMIVLIVMAFISGGVAIVVSSASSAEKRVVEAGKKLFAQMNFALDEALMQRRLIGLRIETNETPSSYSWHGYENARWQPLEEPWTEQILAEEISVEVSIDDELLEALLEDSLNNLSEEEFIPPAIIFYPNSDVSEFELVLVVNDDSAEPYRFRIYIDEAGQLKNSFIENNIASNIQ
ncbi:MAG: type II secretion system protein H [Candidatus Endobugula sp.]|jgi:type II secretion system protein H